MLMQHAVAGGADQGQVLECRNAFADFVQRRDMVDVYNALHLERLRGLEVTDLTGQASGPFQYSSLLLSYQIPVALVAPVLAEEDPALWGFILLVFAGVWRSR